ncbi:MAG: LITAF-like zinc ribbon domain-containing protein [Pyrinomonadaceae bacterium]
MQCQNCGQLNNGASNFCRFCGTMFAQNQFAENNNYEYAPPRPYSWKTDEFQITDKKPSPKNQQMSRVSPLPNPYSTNQPARPQPLVHQPNNMAYGYRCPRCASQAFPTVRRRISTAGWITFAVLLATTGIFCWIGLLIKEDVRVCPVCNLQLS